MPYLDSMMGTFIVHCPESRISIITVYMYKTAILPGLVAVGCVSNMRKVAVSILGSGNILSLNLVMKSLLRPFAPYR